MSDPFADNLIRCDRSYPLLTVTMKNDKSTDKDFTQADLDAGRTACIVSDNREAGMGVSGNKIAGRVVHVSAELDENDIPNYLTVEIGGLLPFKYTGSLAVNQMVEVNGAGLIQVATAADAIATGGPIARGQVFAIDTVTSMALVLI